MSHYEAYFIFAHKGVIAANYAVQVQTKICNFSCKSSVMINFVNSDFFTCDVTRNKISLKILSYTRDVKREC